MIKGNKIILFVFLIGLLLFEITYELTPQLGYILYALVVLAVLWIYSKSNSDREDLRLLVLLIIVPLLRIAEIFIDVGFTIKALSFYVAFAFLIIFYIFRFGIEIKTAHKSYKYSPFIIAFGLGIGFFITKFSAISTDINLLFFLPLIAVTEELYFRSMIQGTLKNLYGANISVFSSALLYLIFSLSFGFTALFFFIMSAISALLYEKTENIYLCMMLNFTAQLVIFVV